MKFTYSLVSDLHVDHPHPKTPPMEQNVIVAGDTGNGLIGLKMLQKLKRKGHTVFAVDGNHEHYANRAQGRTISETSMAFYAGVGGLPIAYPCDEVLITGCNGWYAVNDEQAWLSYMHDGRFIGASGDEVTELARLQARAIDSILTNETERKVIVVTHTATTMRSLDPRYDGHYSNEWYWNPFMEPLVVKHAAKIAVWHHGHTHSPVDVVVDGVRIVTNPRGYPGENPGWAPLTMEIEL